MCPPVIVRAGSGQAKAAFCHGPFYYFSFLPRVVLLLPLFSSRFFLLVWRTVGLLLTSVGKRRLARFASVRARRRPRLPIWSRFHRPVRSDPTASIRSIVESIDAVFFLSTFGSKILMLTDEGIKEEQRIGSQTGYVVVRVDWSVWRTAFGLRVANFIRYDGDFDRLRKKQIVYGVL